MRTLFFSSDTIWIKSPPCCFLLNAFKGNRSPGHSLGCTCFFLPFLLSEKRYSAHIGISRLFLLQRPRGILWFFLSYILIQFLIGPYFGMLDMWPPHQQYKMHVSSYSVIRSLMCGIPSKIEKHGLWTVFRD